VDSSQLQVSIELLGLPIAVVQSSFLILASSFYQKRNLLKARVIIYAYHHVRLLPPEPLVVKQPKCTQVEEPTLLCNQVQKTPRELSDGAVGDIQFPNRDQRQGKLYAQNEKMVRAHNLL
jgi:hypothetical protein